MEFVQYSYSPTPDLFNLPDLSNTNSTFLSKSWAWQQLFSFFFFKKYFVFMCEHVCVGLDARGDQSMGFPWSWCRR